MRKTAAEMAASWMNQHKSNVDTVVTEINGRYSVRQYSCSSKTAKEVISILGLVAMPGYKASFSTPVGTTIYVMPDNVSKY